MTKVALSGASGNIGRVLRPELLKRGVDLRSAGGSKPLEPLVAGRGRHATATCATRRWSTGCSKASMC